MGTQRDASVENHRTKTHSGSIERTLGGLIRGPIINKFTNVSDLIRSVDRMLMSMDSVRHWDFGGRSVFVVLMVWVVAAIAFLWPPRENLWANWQRRMRATY